MKKEKSSVVLGCFSPPVMVVTFVIEISLAIYVLLRYKLNNKGRAVLAALFCLAGFQLAEYFVCTQSNIAVGAARAGFVSITFLPALGVYLMSLLTKPLSVKTTLGLFAGTALIAAYFLLAPNAFDDYQCTGNYVIFQIGQWQTWLYGVFYFGLIAIATDNGLRFLDNSPAKRKARPVEWMLAGYAAFIMPVAIITVFRPETREAIPSVLCGFAVTLAVILAAKVAPLILKRR